MKAINPHNNKIIEEFRSFTDDEVNEAIERSYKAFQTWKKTSLAERKQLLKNLAEVLEKHSEEYAKVIALEMGKPILESVGEVKKAAKHALYCSNNIESFVKDDEVKTENSKSVVEFHPLGPIFVVTPFNFPVWLSIKGSLPALSIGNTMVVKVASSCPRTGICLEEAFKEAGFTDEFILVRTTQQQSELVISNKYIRGVSFTGSSKGGSTVASLAGKYCKKSTMELGGNDPLIVLEDGDADLAADIAIASRLRNCG
jgi:succinate-semialdehyde dehydrogenase/glutarate-semialdehyde dehydrogenase